MVTGWIPNGTRTFVEAQNTGKSAARGDTRKQSDSDSDAVTDHSAERRDRGERPSGFSVFRCGTAEHDERGEGSDAAPESSSRRTKPKQREGTWRRLPVFRCRVGG